MRPSKARPIIAITCACAFAISLCGCQAGIIDLGLDGGGADDGDGGSGDGDGGPSDGDCPVHLAPVGANGLTVAAGDPIYLQVLLTDCAGPMADQVVVFSIYGPDLGATLNPPEAMTDPAGVAGTTLTAGVQTGLLAVQASHPAAAERVTFSLEVLPAACQDHCWNSVQDCGETGLDCGGTCEDCGDNCEGHCSNGILDCEETEVDCGGGGCAACGDPCLDHCLNGITDCGETDTDCGGECAACADPCLGHCTNNTQDCGETGLDCGADCAACADPCAGHCHSGIQDCGETGRDCGGDCSICGQAGCTFPQGVPEADYTSGDATDATIAAAVNAVMASLSGCSIGSDCTLVPTFPSAQSWFDAVNQELRAQGFCAGQHEENYTDEIAVSDTGCSGRWFGYHIYNYGGGKVVWNPGAQRGWWAIDPSWCP